MILLQKLNYFSEKELKNIQGRKLLTEVASFPVRSTCHFFDTYIIQGHLGSTNTDPAAIN